MQKVILETSMHKITH